MWCLTIHAIPKGCAIFCYLEFWMPDMYDWDIGEKFQNVGSRRHKDYLVYYLANSHPMSNFLKSISNIWPLQLLKNEDNRKMENTYIFSNLVSSWATILDSPSFSTKHLYPFSHIKSLTFCTTQFLLVHLPSMRLNFILFFSSYYFFQGR